MFHFRVRKNTDLYPEPPESINFHSSLTIVDFIALGATFPCRTKPNKFCPQNVVSVRSQICKKVTTGIAMSVRPAALTLAPTGQIYIKSDIWLFFENLSRNFKFD